MSAITINQLAYWYRSDLLRKKKVVLHPFSLSIPEGEAFGFLGHNGAGKTTTIKCLLNLISPKEGTISLFGQDSKNTDSRKLVSYLPEQPYFYDNVTVLETLQFFARLYQLPNNGRQKIEELLIRIGLTEKRKAKLRELSKGLMQRVALAQALLNEPKLLILDEPFSGLDPIGRKEFREIFLAEKQRGTTLFMASHILNDVQTLCDRVSIMANGHLKGVYVTREIPNLSPPRYEIQLSHNAEYFLSQFPLRAGPHGEIIAHDYATAATVLEEALRQGIKVTSFVETAGSLEELFLTVVQAELGKN